MVGQALRHWGPTPAPGRPAPGNRAQAGVPCLAPQAHRRGPRGWPQRERRRSRLLPVETALEPGAAGRRRDRTCGHDREVLPPAADPLIPPERRGGTAHSLRGPDPRADRPQMVALVNRATLGQRRQIPAAMAPAAPTTSQSAQSIRSAVRRELICYRFPSPAAHIEPYLRRLLQSMSRTATTSSRLLVQPGQLGSVGTHLLHSVVPAPISEARSVSTRTASPGCAASAAIAPAR